MKRLLIGLSLAILVVAKPELYREKEDFQYSRSSSDEGSKSGYYDSQRGNMGGNYERAHNMDGLAQHQMGGLVKQVEGELGDGSKTRTGSVFTAANSQGIYGSGRYDLSNLGGRNFQEGATYHDSQSYLSAGSQAHSSQYLAQNNARYNTDTQSHSSGFGGFHQSDNLQEAQNSYGTREYERGSQAQRSSKYYLQSGYQGSSDYERSNINHQASNNFGADTQNRLISSVPVRIVIRPGTRVAIPVATQTHGRSHAASYDQSSANSEAEVLNTGDQQAVFRPSGDAKHYESSYSYRKAWEKHDTKPVAVPLATPVFPVSNNNDESLLHHGSDYTQNTDYNLASSHVRQQAGLNFQHSALSSESRHQADYNAQQRTASSNLNSNAYLHSGYNSDANSHSANLIGTITSKPKSYHSAYSYHKSWERQGDPYVIIPPSNGANEGQTSQRLTDLSGSQGDYSSHNYGSRKSQQTYSIKDCVVECDPNSHIRVARSYNSELAQSEEQNQMVHDNQESWGQQSQNGWEEIQNLSQQTQNNLDNLEQLGQETQNNWEQQIQVAGQQVQNKLDNLEDLGQQTQNQWNQQTQNAAQQVHNKWESLEDLGQQAQNKWEQQNQDAGQQVQNKWENLEDLNQQTQNKWEQSQDGGQQTDNNWDLVQQTQNQLDKEKNTGQEILNGWNNLESFGQQSEKAQDQQTQDNWDTEKQGNQKPIRIEDLGQHTQAKWNPLEEQNQEHPEFENQDGNGWWPSQNKPQEQPLKNVDLVPQNQDSELEQTQKFDNQNVFEQTIDHDKSLTQTFRVEDLSQQTPGFWNHFNQFSNNHGRTSDENINRNRPVTTTKELTSQTNTLGPQNSTSLNTLWGKLDDLDDDIAPSSVPLQSQNTGFSQTSSSHSLWGKLDDISEDTSSSSVNTQHTHNTDFSQTSSSHNLWEEPDDLGEDTASPSVNTQQTHNTDFSQTSSSHNLWGKLDDLGEDTESSSVNTHQTHNTDFLQTSNSHSLWEKQGFMNEGDIASSSGNTLHIQNTEFSPPSTLLNNKPEVNDQHLIHNNYNDIDRWSLKHEKNNNTVHFRTIDVLDEKSTTENDFLVTVIDDKSMTVKNSLVDNKTRTNDFGRGDIGPEDSLIYLSPVTSQKSIINDDKLNQQDTTEVEVLDTTEVELRDTTELSIIEDDLVEESLRNKKLFIDDDNEQSSPFPFPFQKTTQRSNINMKPHKHVADDKVPEEIEQQYETQKDNQGFQLHNEQKFDYFGQNQFQHESSEQEQRNTDFGNFQGNKPISWEQYSHKQINGLENQQFVDNSQMNQQWHSGQQNLQQQFAEDFYQQNQHPQLQNSYTIDFHQHNVESPLPDFEQQNVRSEFDVLPTNKQPEKKIEKDYVEKIVHQPNTKLEKAVGSFHVTGVTGCTL